MNKAKYRGIPCFFDLETSEIKGQNKFYDLLLDCVIWIDVHVFQVEGFPVLVEENQDNLE